MLRVLALLAALATGTTLTGSADAHPPDINDRYPYGHGGVSYSQPTYVQPSYAQPSYVQPRHAQPSYVQPGHGAAYRAPPRARVGSYAGYTSPGYGYRHRRAKRFVHVDRPLPYASQLSFGHHATVPSSGRFDYGYSGGPIYGTHDAGVIDGVRFYGGHAD